MNSRAIRTLFFAVSVLFLVEPLIASAYIDPGSGSLLIQMLIASAVGVSVILRTSWSRIRLFFVRKVKEDPEISENKVAIEDQG